MKILIFIFIFKTKLHINQILYSKQQYSQHLIEIKYNFKRIVYKSLKTKLSLN